MIENSNFHNKHFAGDLVKHRPNPMPSPSLSEMRQESLFAVLWRHAWLVIITAILALVGGLVYVLKATPYFESTSRIYVEQTGPKIMKDMEEGLFAGSKNYLYTQAELLKATPILSDALQKCEAHKLRTFVDVDNKVEYLKRNINASVGKKDDILSVSLLSPYPAEAAQIVNTVVDAYITFHSQRKQSTSSEVLKILQKEKTLRSDELSQKLRALTEYKKEHESLAFQTHQSNMLLDRMQMLSNELTRAELQTLEAKTAYETARDMMADPKTLEQFIKAQQLTNRYGGDADLIRLKSELESLYKRRSDRLRELTEDHPAITALEVEIERFEDQIKNIKMEYGHAQLASAEQVYRTAKAQEEQLSQHYEEHRVTVIALNEELAQYTLLESEYEQTKGICDILDERIRELNVTEDVGALNITILETAQPAADPSEPQKARLMAMALVLGLMLGGGLALLRDMMDHCVRSIDEITKLTNTPLLGTVPSMSKRESLQQRGQKVHLDSLSTVAEAYRTIRTAVFFSIPQEQARVIQVTSSMTAEGKSTLASNLGIAMAQSGQSVLIIDADCRRPNQHLIHGCERQQGLSAVVTGMQTHKEAIRSTAIERLDLMPCGPETPNPSELLGSENFTQLLQKLAAHYDRIIVDSPPVSPVADASILAARCDATILVVRAEKTRRKALLRSCETLLHVGGRIVGCVVNDVRKRGHYGYYYQGGHDGPYRNGKEGNGKKRNNLRHPKSERVPLTETLGERESYVTG